MQEHTESTQCEQPVSNEEMLNQTETLEDVEVQEIHHEDEDEAQGCETSADTQDQHEPDYRDKYIRLQAEWDNYRKRTAADSAQAKLRALKDITQELIGIMDDIERALDHVEKQGQATSEIEQFAQGIQSIQTKLANLLERKADVHAINPQPGEPFDIIMHQAVSTIEHDEYDEDSVGAVYQKGYQMGQDILRPAMVVVTTKPTSQNKE